MPLDLFKQATENLKVLLAGGQPQPNPNIERPQRGPAIYTRKRMLRLQPLTECHSSFLESPDVRRIHDEYQAVRISVVLFPQRSYAHLERGRPQRVRERA